MKTIIALSGLALLFLSGCNVTIEPTKANTQNNTVADYQPGANDQTANTPTKPTAEKPEDSSKKDDPKPTKNTDQNLMIDGKPAGIVKGRIKRMKGDSSTMGFGTLCYMYDTYKSLPVCISESPELFKLDDKTGEFEFKALAGEDLRVQVWSQWVNEVTGDQYRNEEQAIPIPGQTVSVSLNEWVKE